MAMIRRAMRTDITIAAITPADKLLPSLLSPVAVTKRTTQK
jgi:hypothetical protein